MYEVNIKEFEGPLDLLLHLIKKSNISIYDISIDVITKQYLDYINKMEELNLNIASEYLVMAAELMEIKSSTLLPNFKNEEDEEEVDPKMELINKLVEYEQYKNITEKLKTLEGYRKEVYTKEPDNLVKFKDNCENIDYGFNLDDLVNAFNNVINSFEDRKPLDTKIANKEYSISKRSFEIKKILKEKHQINFIDLFDVYNKEYLVVTFLSILSLTKKDEILIEQENNFQNIVIKEKGVK